MTVGFAVAVLAVPAALAALAAGILVLRWGARRRHRTDVRVLDAVAGALATSLADPPATGGDPARGPRWERAVAVVRAGEDDASSRAVLDACARVLAGAVAAPVPVEAPGDLHGAVTRDFAEALAQGHLSVSFQPTVALAGSTVVGAEALARWEHPVLGPLPPEQFVPVLEATGRINDLTLFVLDRALAAVRDWLDRGLGMGVAVNVPVAQLADADFPDTVAAALAAHRVPASLLTLELTESGVSADRPAALPAVRRLRALGCRIAVDDFGTGQSTLAHLRGLPVDQLKIDKSFVSDMDAEQGRAVVRAIVEMGHSLGLTVVAEGVERTADRDALVALGCDVAQGYLVSRPLPAGRLDRWLADLEPRPGADAAASSWGPRPLRVTGAV